MRIEENFAEIGQLDFPDLCIFIDEVFEIFETQISLRHMLVKFASSRHAGRAFKLANRCRPQPDATR